MEKQSIYNDINCETEKCGLIYFYIGYTVVIVSGHGGWDITLSLTKYRLQRVYPVTV